MRKVEPLRTRASALLTFKSMTSLLKEGGPSPAGESVFLVAVALTTCESRHSTAHTGMPCLSTLPLSKVTLGLVRVEVRLGNVRFGEVNVTTEQVELLIFSIIL